MSPRRLAKLLAWLGSAVLAAVVVVTVVVVRHRAGGRLIREAATVVPGALLSARNFHWTQMKSEHKQWELSARAATFSDDKKSLRLRDAELAMVADDGKRVRLVAPEAYLALNGNHVDRAELSGGLKVHYGDIMLSATGASFTPDSDDLEVPGSVVIEGQGLKVTGVGLTAHPHEETLELHEQVRTEVAPSQSRQDAQSSVAP